ncbi:hypothetical protein SAMN05428950_104237 [Sphingomonas sp. OV641]|jgi:hypothetical protein|uniref:hypothetical protein n=1 Tax=Sphingomonas sp. OV641 TaxID=1881068 RepID=UPI0008C11812|nr:hypothetical protein [Sphingomonas sp. OV641]SEJ90095.1 hypothetical protein SAMN05428950_104237 [Sphingomonas sp. OV641]
MTYGIVEQWHPAPALIGRKALIFDLSWQGGEKRLIATVWFTNEAGVGEENASAVIIFEDVFAFQVLDENMEFSGITEDNAVVPKIGFPWGGRWPYLEVHSSEWIRQLAEHDGAWKASEFRHLVITTESLHLHVACRKLSPPSYHFAG